MVDLPNGRTLDEPPFTNSRLDVFNTFLIKEGKNELKRYGTLFTCLASRALHIECTCSMDTDSLIQALQRFIARRGNVRVWRSDNGSNFVGAQKELGKAIKEIGHQKIQYFCQNIWFRLHHLAQKPTSIQLHGRCLRETGPVSTDHSVFSLNTHGRSLNDKSLRTLRAENEAILNSRTLTVDTLGEV